MHRIPSLPHPGHVTLGIGIVHLPGPKNIQVMLGVAVGVRRGVLAHAGDGAAEREDRHRRKPRCNLFRLSNKDVDHLIRQRRQRP